MAAAAKYGESSAVGVHPPLGGLSSLPNGGKWGP